MKNIVLIGMPGSGKTSIGRRLAEKLQREFFDADVVLEEREAKSISEFFALGEEEFRDAEERTIVYLSEMENSVIATGGGAILREENMNNLANNGIIFFINRPLDLIIKDIDSKNRPLLKDNTNKIYELYKQREKLYRKYADYVVGEGRHFEEIVGEILAILREDE